MLTRIGDLAQGKRLAATLLATQGRMREAEAAVASGKAASRYDQIADAAGQLVRAKDARQLKAAFADQGERLTDRLRVMDGALGRLVDVADRARVTLVQRLGGNVGGSVPLDAEVDAMLAEVEAALNTKFDRQYLFAGSRGDGPAVALPATPITTADPTLYYQGDQVVLSARAEVGVEIDYGVTADEAGFAELIAALGQARQAHLADDRVGLQAAMAGLGTALDELTGLRGDLGAKTARLETITDGHRAGIVYLDEVVSGIEDADLPEVLTRLARDQASVEATYLVTGRLAALSLADYLR
jgi:flagellar hook-associated protein 3 FlgL